MMFGADSGLLHAVRGKDNKDYIVYVITSGGEGHNYLCIVRRLSSTFPDNTLSNCHILPMILEMQFEDITFGLFPKAQYVLVDVLTTRESTVEDAVHTILFKPLRYFYFFAYHGINSESNCSGCRFHS